MCSAIIFGGCQEYILIFDDLIKQIKEKNNEFPSIAVMRRKVRIHMQTQRHASKHTHTNAYIHVIFFSRFLWPKDPYGLHMD